VGCFQYRGGRRRRGRCPEEISLKSLPGTDDKSTRLGEHPLMALDLAIYIVLRLSGLLTALALVAVIVLKGGWEAAAGGLMLFVGMVFALSFIALLMAQDRTSAPTRA
jgi:hypothetical protein